MSNEDAETSAPDTPSEARAREEHAVALYNLYRDYVKHEDTLINQRISWMLTIHGFLYASYGFTLQKLLEVSEKITAATLQNSYAGYAETPRLKWALIENEVFLFMIAVVGISISLLASVSVTAALKASDNVQAVFYQHAKTKRLHLKRSRPSAWSSGDSQEITAVQAESLVLPGLTGGGLEGTVLKGGSAGTYIPRILLASWFFALAAQAAAALHFF